MILLPLISYRNWLRACCLLTIPIFLFSQPPKNQAQQAKVTILSTVLAHGGVGEWGFSALVEVDGHRLLFDTGKNPETVLVNAKELKVELQNVSHVLLSHHHDDHCGGLLQLRNANKKINPDALKTVHVGQGIFANRNPNPDLSQSDFIHTLKKEFEESGGEVILHEKPQELFPGVWLSGRIPRISSEHNWPAGRQIYLADGKTVMDDMAEDMALYIRTKKGVIVIGGCGHAGAVNTIAHVQNLFGSVPIEAYIGGLHSTAKSEKEIEEIGIKMKEVGVTNLIGAHCSSLYSIWQLKEQLGLDRSHCIVAAVGTVYESSGGIITPLISK